MTHLDKFAEALHVVAEDGLLERRVERIWPRVDRLRDATVVLEYTARHSAQRRRLLPRRPVQSSSKLKKHAGHGGCFLKQH